MIKCPLYKVWATFTHCDLMYQVSNNLLSILTTFLVEIYSFKLGISDVQFSILNAAMQ